MQLRKIFIEFVGPCLLNQRRKSLDVRGRVLQRSLLKSHRWELERDGGDKGERGEEEGASAEFLNSGNWTRNKVPLGCWWRTFTGVTEDSGSKHDGQSGWPLQVIKRSLPSAARPLMASRQVLVRRNDMQPGISIVFWHFCPLARTSLKYCFRVPVLL